MTIDKKIKEAYKALPLPRAEDMLPEAAFGEEKRERKLLRPVIYAVATICLCVVIGVVILMNPPRDVSVIDGTNVGSDNINKNTDATGSNEVTGEREEVTTCEEVYAYLDIDVPQAEASIGSSNDITDKEESNESGKILVKRSDGKELVWITRDVVSRETIADELLKRYGYSWYEYEWDNNYKEIVEPRLIAEFYEEHSIDPDVKIEDLTGELYLQLQKMLRDNMNDYMRSIRTVTSDLITACNNEFLKRHSIDEKDVLYNGIFTETIIAYATRDQIKAIAADDEVNDVSIWEDHESQVQGTITHMTPEEAKHETEN